jgi:hypothetical protein
LDIGNYTISTEFSGDERYNGCKAESQEKINSPIDLGYGYWLIGYNMYNVNLSQLASLGTKDILINYYAINLFGEKNVSEWAKKASEYGIRVHIWMQIVYKDGKWEALQYLNGTFKYDLINSRIEEAKYYANISGIAGIHFDYLRYGGTAYLFTNASDSINYFVERTVSEVKKINPNCIVSAAVMPEPDTMLYFDLQDIPKLSKYLDVVIPMVYKRNFYQKSPWIGEMTQKFIEMSNGAQIWTGLQTYNADDDPTPLSYDEIFNDAQLSFNSNANGVILFRLGVTELLNFNKLTNI